MPRAHKAVLLPSDQIDAANNLLASNSGQISPETPNLVVTEAEFPDGFCMTITVNPAGTPLIMVELYSQTDELKDHETVTGTVDQDYVLNDGDNIYELSIGRAASTTLTPATLAAYNEAPDHCPACRSTDIHTGPPQIEEKTCRVRAECCACEARWVNLFQFETISTAVDDWDPPTRNVAMTNQS